MLSSFFNYILTSEPTQPPHFPGNLCICHGPPDGIRPVVSSSCGWPVASVLITTAKCALERRSMTSMIIGLVRQQRSSRCAVSAGRLISRVVGHYRGNKIPRNPAALHAALFIVGSENLLFRCCKTMKNASFSVVSSAAKRVFDYQ